MLRGRPVAIVNRRTEHTGIVTASYEAKAYGVKVGMKFRDAKLLAPGLIGLESDPGKYRYVYHRLMDIMRDYSADIVMKSIDEGVIDFHDSSTAISSRELKDIGYEIKQRLKDEIGVWMRCNIGIGPNRFLAKMAASLNKPDGLDEINQANIRQVFATLKLTDLTGIAWRNQMRLNAVGIFTPLELLDADVETLEKVVFKSIVGRQWYQRLRGWEVDDLVSDVQRVGRQYVLERFDLRQDEILQRLHHLCESVGSRMRRQNKSARGIYVYSRGDNGYWHASRVVQLPFFSDKTIFSLARELFNNAPSGAREIGIHCYKLEPIESQEISLFQDEINRERQVVEAIDSINAAHGDRAIHSANTLGAGIYVSQKIPFGSTRYL